MRWRRIRLCRWLVGLAGVLCILARPHGAAGSGSREKSPDTIKAEFIYNVAQLTTWPEKSFANPQVEFVLGVVGDDPMAEALAHFFDGQIVQGRKTIVRRFETADELSDCHMLFIANSKRNMFEKILKTVEGQSILTISDADGFTEKSGMFSIFIRQTSDISGVIAWDINFAAIKRANLQPKALLITRARKSIR